MFMFVVPKQIAHKMANKIFCERPLAHQTKKIEKRQKKNVKNGTILSSKTP